VPSRASVCPIRRRDPENRAQFVPEESTGSVTTPNANVMAKIRARTGRAVPHRVTVRSAATFRITRKSASPIVSCGNR
jgi:hypothetical protein